MSSVLNDFAGTHSVPFDAACDPDSRNGDAIPGGHFWSRGFVLSSVLKNKLSCGVAMSLWLDHFQAGCCQANAIPDGTKVEQVASQRGPHQ